MEARDGELVGCLPARSGRGGSLPARTGRGGNLPARFGRSGSLPARFGRGGIEMGECVGVVIGFARVGGWWRIRIRVVVDVHIFDDHEFFCRYREVWCRDVVVGKGAFA